MEATPKQKFSALYTSEPQLTRALAAEFRHDPKATELYFSSLPWPDFNRTELWRACEAYAGRERRYGGAVDKVLREDPGETMDPQDDEQ